MTGPKNKPIAPKAIFIQPLNDKMKSRETTNPQKKKGSNHENSDIDLAIVLSKNNKSFDTEVKLMTSACPPGR